MYQYMYHVCVCVMCNVYINLFFCSEGLSTSKCGNYVIDEDEGEECDGGRLTVDDQDSCCDSNCKLRKGSNCRYTVHVLVE